MTTPDALWAADVETLAMHVLEGNRLDGSAAKSAAAQQVLEARLTMATERTARWTKWMAIVTAGLALGSILIASFGYVAQRSAARAAERQSCLAYAQAAISLADHVAPFLERANADYVKYRDELRHDLVSDLDDCE